MSRKKNETTKWVEAMLAAHPAEVADDGFSARVVAEIKLQEQKRFFVLAPFFIAGFAFLLWFFPAEIFTGLGRDFVTNFRTLMPYLVPAGAAAVLFLFSLFSEEAA